MLNTREKEAVDRAITRSELSFPIDSPYQLQKFWDDLFEEVGHFPFEFAVEAVSVQDDSWFQTKAHFDYFKWPVIVYGDLNIPESKEDLYRIISEIIDECRVIDLRLNKK